MNRLPSELHRLYRSSEPGQARALLLELARPADWGLLARVWRGVQAELALPAPAIAVSGSDGFQLWFSLAKPIQAARAQALLEGLCQRYLPEVPPARLRLASDAEASLPPRQQQADQWAAFVAPDLAPVFADTPWLDIPPGDEGQADLLSGLASIAPAALEQAMAMLAPVAPTSSAPEQLQQGTAAPLEPRQFLLQVMRDENAPLALRVEAAKVLLG